MKVLSCHNCGAPSCAARYLQKKKGPEKKPLFILPYLFLWVWATGSVEVRSDGD